VEGRRGVRRRYREPDGHVGTADGRHADVLLAATELGERLTEAHYRQQVALRSLTLRQVLTLWPALRLDSFDTIDRTWPAVEQALMTLIPARFTDSAGLAARYFTLFRQAEGVGGVADALLATAPAEELVTTALRVTGPYTAKHLVALKDPKASDRTLTRLAGSVSRIVGNGGRDTLDRSVSADRRALGYARVTSPNGCAFCRLLASRGPVYKADTALRRADGKKYHDHCSCTKEPVYARDQPWPGRAREFRDEYDRVTADASSSAEARLLHRRAVEGR
jgi:hypothetical protein